mmetsp:Transcript_12050/g.15701  ORF Transcript_12050/g.15701 Transcript_12050/m.15701 type:complete len:130 (-) Transcript_12050:42-431(-)
MYTLAQYESFFDAKKIPALSFANALSFMKPATAAPDIAALNLDLATSSFTSFLRVYASASKMLSMCGMLGFPFFTQLLNFLMLLDLRACHLRLTRVPTPFRSRNIAMAIRPWKKTCLTPKECPFPYVVA